MTLSSRRALTATLLLMSMAGLPAATAAASATSPAVVAARAGGTPVIPPPKHAPKPFTCTPNKKTKRCVKVAPSKCKTSRGVKTCATKKVTCTRTSSKYKRCITTTGTCRTARQRKSGKLRKTCRTTGRRSAVKRLAASVADGPIALVALPGAAAARHARTPRARPSTLISATGPPVPAALGSTAHAAAAVPLGAGVGALVLILALLAVMGRRRPRAGR